MSIKKRTRRAARAASERPERCLLRGERSRTGLARRRDPGEDGATVVKSNTPAGKGVSRPRRRVSPQDLFVALLNNREKGQATAAAPVRSRGFVVLVRNAESLQLFEGWCAEQTWNSCLTARYRIDGGPVFGTLFAALLADLRARQSGADDHKLSGHLIYKSDEWDEAIKAGVLVPPTGVDLDAMEGTLDESQVEHLLDQLESERVLPKGRRLVLLAELPESPDPEEWGRAKADLFARLPERVGLVLANPPDGFELPADDPHFLTLDLSGLAAADEASEAAYVYKPTELASDRATEDDHLNVMRYADALARLLLHPETGPMTVAIHGPWGKGKSSFMNFVKTRLVDVPLLDSVSREGTGPLGSYTGIELDERKLEERLRAASTEGPPGLVTVDFNAWRFEDSTQIWAGLASVITVGLERKLPRWRRWWMRVRYAAKRQGAALVLHGLIPAAVAGLIVLTAFVWVPELRDWLDKQLASSAAATLLGGLIPAAGSVIAATWLLVARVRRALQPVSGWMLTYGRRPDYREQMGYQHVVLGDIEFVHDELKRAYDEPRVFVFIDDLDRCQPEKVVTVLQAINLLLGESDFYVILGIDTAMVHRAIESHYTAAQDDSLPAHFGATYLHKIIQLAFHLPATTEKDRGEFIAQLFSEAARKALDQEGEVPPEAEVEAATQALSLPWSREALRPLVSYTSKAVQDTPTELRAFLDFQRYVADNPRELKRLVNLHRFVKIVLQQEGWTVTDPIQRKLVKWLIFCARWQGLVDDVLLQARKDTEAEDVIAAVPAEGGGDAAELREFAATVSPADVLTAEDLAEDGPFDRAANISQLVVWEPASSEGTAEAVADAALAAR